MKTYVVAIILACLQNSPAIKRNRISTNRRENSAVVDISPRILYGKPATVSDFGFMVHVLGLKVESSFCGGFIIARKWAITAGSCIVGIKCSTIRLRPAVWNSLRYMTPQLCHVHPKYVKDDVTNDISLLKIRGDFLADKRIKTIPLPPADMVIPAGTRATIVGWGNTESYDLPNRLLKADVRIGDWKTCNKEFLTKDRECMFFPWCTPPNMPDSVMCTIGMPGSTGSGTCFGDFGGPVIVKGYAIAVTSFMLTLLGAEDSYCRFDAPSYHTSVIPYLPWIYGKINK